MKSHIFNVIIGGTSIGMTFSYLEACTWVNQSMYQGEKKIVKVAYKEPK